VAVRHTVQTVGSSDFSSLTSVFSRKWQ